MAWFLVESQDYEVLHAGRSSAGVVGEGGGAEKIYLHVIEVTEAELTQLGPREDELGNKQHDRLALPRNEEWWIAVDGEATWPKLYRPRLRSHCTDLDTKPRPVPLSGDDLKQLRKAGAALPDEAS